METKASMMVKNEYTTQYTSLCRSRGYIDGDRDGDKGQSVSEHQPVGRGAYWWIVVGG